MVDRVVAPDPNQPFVDQNGVMARRPSNWTQLVTDLDPLTGDGSPEGVVEAKQKRFYIDLNGTPGAILYVKRDADIGGDRRQGWVAV